MAKHPEIKQKKKYSFQEKLLLSIFCIGVLNFLIILSLYIHI